MNANEENPMSTFDPRTGRFSTTDPDVIAQQDADAAAYRDREMQDPCTLAACAMGTEPHIHAPGAYPAIDPHTGGPMVVGG